MFKILIRFDFVSSVTIYTLTITNNWGVAACRVAQDNLIFKSSLSAHLAFYAVVTGNDVFISHHHFFIHHTAVDIDSRRL